MKTLGVLLKTKQNKINQPTSHPPNHPPKQPTNQPTRQTDRQTEQTNSVNCIIHPPNVVQMHAPLQIVPTSTRTGVYSAVNKAKILIMNAYSKCRNQIFYEV